MTRPLRVAVPMLTYVPGGMGGSETFARELYARLAVRSDVEVTRYVSRAGAGALGGSGDLGDREVVVPWVRGGPGTAARLTAVTKAAVDRRLARRIAATADVVHYPFTVPVPRVPGVPHVVTLHDVQHLDLPELFSRAERQYRRVTYDRAARRADQVVTDSEFSRGRIVDALGIAPDRVRSIPLGVGSAFTPDPTVAREDFVLYPARRWPHKNHARLIEAMHVVRERHPQLRLVLTGGGADLPSAPSWVEQRGDVSLDELVGLYRRARCLAFPSLYEGFGLPVLEAMGCGTPVAMSETWSGADVVGPGVEVFDPVDVRSIADGVACAARAGDVGPALADRARLHSWERATEQYVEVYRHLAS